MSTWHAAAADDGATSSDDDVVDSVQSGRVVDIIVSQRPSNSAQIAPDVGDRQSALARRDFHREPTTYSLCDCVTMWGLSPVVECDGMGPDVLSGSRRQTAESRVVVN